MRFLTLYTPDDRTSSAMPTPEHTEEMGKFMEEMESSGVLLATGGLLAGAGLRVRRSRGKTTVSEGASNATQPFVGFAILQVNSRDEAIEVSERFLRVAGDGESELRQLMDAPPQAVAKEA